MSDVTQHDDDDLDFAEWELELPDEAHETAAYAATFGGEWPTRLPGKPIWRPL